MEYSIEYFRKGGHERKTKDKYDEINMFFFFVVEQLSRLQQECINMEMLNDQLPKPGEPGAPCLPNHLAPSQLLFNGN